MNELTGLVLRRDLSGWVLLAGPDGPEIREAGLLEMLPLLLQLIGGVTAPRTEPRGKAAVPGAALTAPA